VGNISAFWFMSSALRTLGQMPPVLNEDIPNLLSLSFPLLKAHGKTCVSSLILLHLQLI
jgi:hypothetical protein